MNFIIIWLCYIWRWTCITKAIYTIIFSLLKYKQNFLIFKFCTLNFSTLLLFELVALIEFQVVLRVKTVSYSIKPYANLKPLHLGSAWSMIFFPLLVAVTSTYLWSNIKQILCLLFILFTKNFNHNCTYFVKRTGI